MDVLWLLNLAAWDQVKQLLNHRCLQNPTLPCADFTWSLYSKCSIQSLLASVSPALWWWCLKLSSVCAFFCKKPSARPKVLLRQRDPGSRGTVPNPRQGAGVCTRGWLRSLAAAVSGSGCSQTAQAVHRGGVWAGRGEDTCSGCFCTRSCWHQNSPMFPRLISKPTWLLSHCESHSSESSTWTIAVHFVSWV